MRIHSVVALLALITGSILPLATASAATISVVSAGGAKYVVQGGAFTGVAALDVTVKYDSGTLSAPKVEQGALANGTLFVANPNLAGQVRLAFVHVSGVSGSGPIATITFTPSGSADGKITGAFASIYDAQGTALPVIVSVGGAVVQQTAGGGSSPQSSEPLWTGGSPSTPQPVETGKPAATTGIGGGAGTITLPGDPFGGSEPAKTAVGEARQQIQPPPPPATEELVRSSAPEVPAPVKERERRTLPPPPASVLERFRSYQGERTVAALKPLFAKRGGEWVNQEPAILPADGKASVNLLITLDRVGLEAPNFALRGLEMTSLKPIGETGWFLEAVSQAGVLQATVSLLVEEASAELPVTVVPPLPVSWAGKKLTEAEVNRFLMERGTDKAPAGDLNNDGRRDYRDDYIMIGNYLLASQPTKEMGVDKGKTTETLKKAVVPENP